MEHKTNAKKDSARDEIDIQVSTSLSKSPKFLTSALSYIQDNYPPAQSEKATDDKYDRITPASED